MLVVKTNYTFPLAQRKWGTGQESGRRKSIKSQHQLVLTYLLGLNLKTCNVHEELMTCSALEEQLKGAVLQILHLEKRFDLVQVNS